MGLGGELGDVQQTQIKLLCEFDRICKEHGIKYQLFAGTLLGAVRHNGFIPWDDDIDVSLLRKDYKKFLQICKKELGPKYFLQTYESDKNYVMQFAKLRMNNTLFIEKATSECNIHHGVYIDVFPMDNVNPNTALGKIQQRLLYVIGRVNLCRVKMHCMSAKNPIDKYVSVVMHYLLKVIPNSSINKLQNKVCCLFENDDTKYVSHLTNGASKSRYSKFMIEKNSLYDSIDGSFEGVKFPIPRRYDYVLTKIYGDYMKLPPEDKRKPHHGVIKIKIELTNQ